MYNTRNHLLLYLLLFTALAASLLPINAEGSMRERNLDMIPACATGNYITLDELYSCCKIPGNCTQQMACEGKFSLLTAFISYINVWSKKEYPWLPHNKFLMYNRSGDKNIEVRISPEAADAVFELIQTHSNHPDNPVYIVGQMAGVDLPAMGACHRDLVITLMNPDDITFDLKFPRN